MIHLSDASIFDLRRSGLSDETIELAQIEDSPFLDHPGYLIPYFDHRARKIESYFRIRHDDSIEVSRYYQQPGSGVRLYLPPNQPRQALSGTAPLIVTEGEKKALKAAQEGFPAIGLGGVWNFQDHTLRLTREAQHDLALSPSSLQITPNDLRRIITALAPEFDNIEWNRTVYLIYDNDPQSHVKGRRDVSAAAAELAMIIETLGGDPKRVFLPPNSNPDYKMGLDDFLVEFGPEALTDLLKQQWHFPSLSNIKLWTVSKLDKQGEASVRARSRGIAAVVVGDLDSRGKRYRDEADAFYYFEDATNSLHQFEINERARDALAKYSFGKLLMDRYGIDPADKHVMHRILSRFATKDPIGQVVTNKAFANDDDHFYIQLNDTEMLAISADEIKLLKNGQNDILFIAGAVDPPLTYKSVEPHLNQPIQNYWGQDIREFVFDTLGNTTFDQTLAMINTLYYVSPYLFRWRGTQLPNEIYMGEPGSGKSYICHWRKIVLCGDPALQTTPTSKREWAVQINAASGMWIYDNANINALPRDFVDQFREAICEINTQPNPVIDGRKLFTDVTRNIIPVQFPFAFTTIRPLYKAYDFLQRSIMLYMHPLNAGQRDGQWYERRIPSRPAYVADQANALQQFLRLCQRKWKTEYKAAHRLVNFEQSMSLMAEVLGMRHLVDPTFEAMIDQAKISYTENSVEFMAILAFREEYPEENTFQASAIFNWVSFQEGFRKASIFRTIGSFIVWLEVNRDTLRRVYNAEVIRSDGNVMVRFT